MKARKNMTARLVVSLAAAVGILGVRSPDTASAAMVTWFKMDATNAGPVTASQLVDSVGGMAGLQVYNGPLYWTSGGVRMAQPSGISLGPQNNTAPIYNIADTVTVYTRFNLNSFANNGQGVSLLNTFRWNGGAPEGFNLQIYTSATPSLNGKANFVWGDGAYHSTDPNQNTNPDGSPVTKIATNVWTDMFWVFSPDNNYVKMYMLTNGYGAGSMTFLVNTYTNAQNQGAISNYPLKALTAGFNTAAIGKEGFGASFDGTMGAFAVWDTALTPAEMLAFLVPEPSALGLCAAGCAVVHLARRRQRKCRER